MTLSASDQMQYITTRIQGVKHSGTSVGTAYFFNFRVDDTRTLVALITNKHVVSGCQKGQFRLHKKSATADLPSGQFFDVDLDNFEKLWIHHPDPSVDLCALPVGPLLKEAVDKGAEVFFKALDETLIPDQAKLNDLMALEEILMVGYPIGLWDAKNNLPVFRKGWTATAPSVDFEGKAIGCVDIASFPGSSGSPVLVFNEGMHMVRGGSLVGGVRAVLLGTLFAGPQLKADGKIEIVEIPTGRVPLVQTAIPIHLGYYVKARELLELKREVFKARNVVASP